MILHMQNGKATTEIRVHWSKSMGRLLVKNRGWKVRMRQQAPMNSILSGNYCSKHCVPTVSHQVFSDVGSVGLPYHTYTILNCNMRNARSKTTTKGWPWTAEGWPKNVKAAIMNCLAHNATITPCGQPGMGPFSYCTQNANKQLMVMTRGRVRADATSSAITICFLIWGGLAMTTTHIKWSF